jgi:hypothetical protein
MTTSVTIKNDGPDRINVNEVDRLPRAQGRTAFSHTLAVGEQVTLKVWGANRYLCVLETDDTDTVIDKAHEAVKPTIEREAENEKRRPSDIMLD